MSTKKVLVEGYMKPDMTGMYLSITSPDSSPMSAQQVLDAVAEMLALDYHLEVMDDSEDQVKNTRKKLDTKVPDSGEVH
jgi:hypothetical protein